MNDRMRAGQRTHNNSIQLFSFNSFRWKLKVYILQWGRFLPFERERNGMSVACTGSSFCYKGLGINFLTVDELSDRQKFNEFHFELEQSSERVFRVDPGIQRNIKDNIAHQFYKDVVYRIRSIGYLVNISRLVSANHRI